MADERAEVAETHISVVVFVGDRAYKLKKPVRTDFCDFSTRPQRLAACLREVELNRRLAPDVYLGVADVIGPDGKPCDHLVVMRRMPSERRLSALVRSGEPAEEVVDEIARRLAAFHAGAGGGPEVDERATRDAVRGLWEQNARQIEQLACGVLDPDGLRRVRLLALRYLEGRGPLFDLRIAQGRARDGHGDLLADDIFCLPDGPRILDCIDFDDRLRYGDVLADVAFLAMDLERLGRPDLAQRFLGRYAEASGDRPPPSLVHHYVAYRAQVRVLVSLLRHAQGDLGGAADAAVHQELCLRHLEAGRVALVLVGGLPGTGKSTISSALASRLGWTVIRSDEVRKELAGLPPNAPAPAAYGEGLYTPEARDAVYAELIARARRLAALGEPVILDASWGARRHREAAAKAAAETSSDLVALRCEAPAEVAASRIASRRGGASDATVQVAEAMASAAEPWPEAAVVPTDRALGESVEAALRAVEAALA